MVEILTSSAFAWYGQAALSLLVLLLLTIAVAATPATIGRAWRRVLYGFVIEHAVIAYGSWEARQADVAVELRVFLLILTLIGLLISLAVLLVEEHRLTLT